MSANRVCVTDTNFFFPPQNNQSPTNTLQMQQESTAKMGAIFFALTHLGFHAMASIPSLFAERNVFYLQRKVSF